MSQNSLKVKFSYADNSTKVYSIPVSDEVASLPSAIKTRILEIKNETGTGAQYKAGMRETFVTSSGAKMTEIINAELTRETEEVVYSG